MTDESPHGALRPFAERFALIAFGLYHLPLFVNNYPPLGGGGFNDSGLEVRWGMCFARPASASRDICFTRPAT